MGVKRWLLVLGLGTAVSSLAIINLLLLFKRQAWLPTSVYNALTLQFLPVPLQIILPLLLGGLLILWGVLKIGRNLTAPFQAAEISVAERIYEHSRHRRGPHIVAIGGGTGMPSLLRGLTEYTRNITAIVTVADDGGSSGRLRREFGLLPPGDFRNNIAALSRDEALMTQVLQYRFGAGVGENGRSELQGHAFGNLLLAALTGITGSFDEALLAAERVLALRGRVLPSTLADVTLEADVKLPNGDIQRVVGESAIPEVNGRIQHVYLQPKNVKAYPPALQAIFQADLIVMGPGSLYTSILPNLLVPDLAEALLHAPAPKIYICNLATQPGETDNYSVADHVASLLQHIPTGCLDLVIANDNQSISPEQGGGNTLYVPLTPPDNLPMKTADLVDEARPWRHDGAKLAQLVMQLLGG
ncbi:FIG002813: LPPG:FO 2-phospho-L-lactate transferase like, CofD-like [hydrothermal vent metagenome]|uniref:FIG002813: LPPG:FO 2-phospho-L-lactate transferase like, CofD-like n=1 Tax=hydrothermal vent metagenome TaxID=652676 RepID=A0A3B0UZ84_9ZZZZ